MSRRGWTNITSSISIRISRRLYPLILKYGEPADDQVVWSADLYKEDDDDWGVSVSLGHLVFGCDWSTNSTDILLMLCGENYEISFVVEYSSQKLKPFEAAARKRKSLLDF